MNPGRRAVRWIAGIHGAYYVVTGIWPLVHLESFLLVTGPKTDLWLVQFFGALVCVPGLVLAHAALSGRLSVAVWIVAIASTAVLGVGDVVCVLRGAVGPVYLIDTGCEWALFAAWGLARYGCRPRGARGAGPTDAS